MLTEIREYLTEHIVCTGSTTIISVILIIATAIVAWAFYHAAKALLGVLEKIVLRSPTDWDDDLVNPRLLKAISQLAPAICVRWLLPGFFSSDPIVFEWLSALTSLYIVVAAVNVIVIFIDNLFHAMGRREKLKTYAVKGFFQMVKLIFICLGVIVGISIVIGRSPMVILTALGASAAVLSLVFKDTILGLVASIQLTANDMLHKGDWIVADRHNANGEVLDVTLTTIKVKNWDNSVSTIPPYSLVSDSFRNYQPMKYSGGRRVERAIYIDANSVRFLEAAELEALASEGWLEGLTPGEAGRTVNLGLLRRYLEHYLLSHPGLNPELTTMVRQMAPTQAGLPLQLYFFTRTTEWTAYESLQSDIFDHVYAVVRRFGLAMFQSPTGTDIARANPAEISRGDA